MDSVDPALYDERYYLQLHGFESFEAFHDSLEKTIDPKHRSVLACCRFGSETAVLDIGCGRGDLIYHALRAGCGRAVGIDYSEDAVRLAGRLFGTAQEGLKSKARFMKGDICAWETAEKFDYCFMVEVWEHLYDEQIVRLLEKVRGLLKKDGALILTTPNALYEKYLYPVKRAVNVPFNLVKFPLRILRGKWRPRSAADFFRHVFKVKAFENPLMDHTHVNVSSPQKIRKMLEKAGFTVKVRCWDDSKNVLSLLFSRWAGREMLVLAKPSG